MIINCTFQILTYSNFNFNNLFNIYIFFFNSRDYYTSISHIQELQIHQLKWKCVLQVIKKLSFLNILNNFLFIFIIFNSLSSLL